MSIGVACCCSCLLCVVDNGVRDLCDLFDYVECCWKFVCCMFGMCRTWYLLCVCYMVCAVLVCCWICLILKCCMECVFLSCLGSFEDLKDCTACCQSVLESFTIVKMCWSGYSCWGVMWCVLCFARDISVGVCVWLHVWNVVCLLVLDTCWVVNVVWWCVSVDVGCILDAFDQDSAIL